VTAYRWTVILLSALGALLLYTAVFAVDEKRYSSAKPSKVPLMKSFRMTLKNRPFIIFLIANMCFWFVFNTLRSSALPIGERLMRVDEEFAGWNFTVLFIVAGLCFILIWYLTRRIGKKRIMLIALGSFFVLSILISLTGVIPIDRKVWGIVVFALFGFPVAVLLVIPNVFISELCDSDFRKTGERREAMYFGVHGFFMKLNLGLAGASLAFFYGVFGKDVANPLGVRLAIVAAAVVSLVGLLVLLRYPEAKVASEAAES
jgi:GPH family glycoside/pentoside/hexuronide:cation symporter